MEITQQELDELNKLRFVHDVEVICQLAGGFEIANNCSTEEIVRLSGYLINYKGFI